MWTNHAGNRLLIAIAAAIGMTLLGTVLFREYWQPQNFHTVESGAIYRGAEQRVGQLRRIIRNYGIRTIVCLVDPEPRERLVAETLGVRWVWLPIGDSSLAVTFDTLEDFVKVVSDPGNQPVFYHCRRGVYRSNLAQGVYRLKCSGWTLEETLAELRSTGFDPDERGGDSCCADVLRKYYEERILGGANLKQAVAAARDTEPGRTE